MKLILSPAKSMSDEPTQPYPIEATSIPFEKETLQLVKRLKQFSTQDIQDLMKVSEVIGELNFRRYQKWSSLEKRPAGFAFQGDVYQGLDFNSLNNTELKRADKVVRILSGIYGMIRPSTDIQNYRLEMGTRLEVDGEKGLYKFWGTKVADLLLQELQYDKDKVLVNLASNEYSKVLNLKKFDFNVVEPAFLDEKNGSFKVMSFYAKRARGLMARFIIQNNLKKVEELAEFNLNGYQFDPESSSGKDLIFKRFEVDRP